MIQEDNIEENLEEEDLPKKDLDLYDDLDLNDDLIETEEDLFEDDFIVGLEEEKY